MTNNVIQAIQAYAALCQAEAMERIADAMEPQVITVSTGIAGVDADGMREVLKDDANNRGDQSIADAIGEQVTDPPDELGSGALICTAKALTAWKLRIRGVALQGALMTLRHYDTDEEPLQ